MGGEAAKRKLLAVLLVLVALRGVGTLGWEKIKIVYSDWHLVEPHWEKALKEAIAQFMGENRDVEVELEYVSYGEKETKYITAPLRLGSGRT